jgi:hypothetical protein
VKYVYCDNCDKAYLKSRLEKGRCIYCGKASEVVDVKRNRLYYTGYGIMVLGAVLMVVIRFFFYNLLLLWGVGIAFIILGGALIMKGNGEMVKEAKRIAHKELLSKVSAEDLTSSGDADN